jgi:hypothetical protein
MRTDAGGPLLPFLFLIHVVSTLPLLSFLFLTFARCLRRVFHVLALIVINLALSRSAQEWIR